MRKLILVLLALLASSCEQPAIRTEQTNNASVEVALLFEHDGYRVYRFYDNGRAHYFVTPAGFVTGSHSESCGKNCVRVVSEEIQTAPLRGD